jgi:hypothetical protein
MTLFPADICVCAPSQGHGKRCLGCGLVTQSLAGHWWNEIAQKWEPLPPAIDLPPPRVTMRREPKRPVAAIATASSLPPVTEAGVINLLRERYGRSNGNGREWAFFSHVRSATGFADRNSSVRTADALAMSMYRSKGWELHGFEVKVSRGDWLGELKKPGKWTGVGGFCDRWWLAVASPDIVKPGELPAGWGLLVPAGGRFRRSSPRLRVATRAARLSPKPLTREFIACVVRRFAYEQQLATQQATLQEKFASLETGHG